MTRLTAFFVAGSAALTLPALAQEKITYADHARAIMENKCFSCHNPDKKKGDLDLTTFAAVMTGGGGGAIVDAGNSAGSKLIGTITKKEEPYMPPEGAPLSPADIDVLKKWIDGGLLDTKSSVAKKSSKPKVDLTVAAGTGKPEGPIARPDNILLEPVMVPPRTTAVTAMAASPWINLVAFAAPKQILLYDTDTRQLAGVLPYTEGYAHSLKFSRSGSLLVMGGGRGGKFGNAVVWDVKTGRRVTEIGKESDSVMSADITPDHSKLVIGSPSKKVKCYDVATGEELYTIAKHTEWVMCTQFSPDGILLATADRNGNVFVWEAENGGEFFLLGQHKGGACTDLAWRADSNVLASCSRDGTVILWEMTEGKQLKTWTAHGGGVESVSWTPDGRLLTCGQDGKAAVWDANGNKQADLPAQGDVATRITACSDNKTCVLANWRGEVKVVDIPSKAELGLLPSNPAKIDQRIAASEQRANELSGKVKPAQDAVAKADADVKALEAAYAKTKNDNAALEARKNALPGEIKTTEQAIAADKAALDKLRKDRETRVAQVKAFTDKQTAVAGLEKQFAPLAADAGRLPAADKALADAKTALEGAKKELTAKAQDAALQARVKDLEGKLAAATADQQKCAQAKQKADPLNAQLAKAKQELGAAPAPVADLDKAIADTDAKIKTSTEALAAKKAEGPKVEAALKNAPNALKDADAKLGKGREALAAAQFALKATTDELAVMQKAGPLLKAAKFNVGLLTEKEALSKLESDLQAYTEGQKDNEAALVSAKQRIVDSQKAVTEATAAIPGLDDKAAKLLAAMPPVEKGYTDLKAVSDGAAGKVNEQKQLITTKEAELAAAAKARDDQTAAAKAAVDPIKKEIAKHRTALDAAAKAVTAPDKRVEDTKARFATVEAELKKLQADLAAAKTAAEQAAAASKKAEADRATANAAVDAANKAVQAAKEKEAKDAANKVLAEKRDVLKKADTDLNAAKAANTKAQSAVNTLVAQEKTKTNQLTNTKNDVAAAEKAAVAPRATLQAAKDKLAGAEKALAEKEAAPAALQKDYEAKAAPINAAIAAAKAALPALEKTLADANAKTAEAQKTRDTRRDEVGAAQAAAAAAKKKKADAEAAIAAATKEIPEREKNIAEAKAEIAKLTPQVPVQKAKVDQLNQQFLSMLPK